MIETPAGIPDWMRWTVWAIQQVGFPIAVAGWVLYRLNGKIGALTEALQDLRVELASRR
jgi:hypothetical protein